MSTTEVLNIETKVQDTPVKNLKKELRECTHQAAALATEGKANTKEYTELLKRMARIKDTMQDVKDQAKGFHPDSFERVATVANGIAGGFSVAAGAMQLFGLNSESAEQAMAKLQAVMAVSMGIAQLKESIELFKMLGTQIKSSTAFKVADNAVTKAAAFVQKLFKLEIDATSTSFKVLKGAIIATGIGALVVLIGEAVSMFNQMGDAAEQAGERYDASMKRINDIKELDNLSLRKRVADLKAAGASEQKIYETSSNYFQMYVQDLEDARKQDAANAYKYDIDIKKAKMEAQAKDAEFNAEQAQRQRQEAKQAQDRRKQEWQQQQALIEQANQKRIQMAEQLAEQLKDIDRQISVNKLQGLNRELLELDHWFQDQQDLIIKNGGNTTKLVELFLQKEHEIRGRYEQEEKDKQAEAKAKLLEQNKTFADMVKEQGDKEFTSAMAEEELQRKMGITSEQEFLEHKLQLYKDYGRDVRQLEFEVAEFKKKTDFETSQARLSIASSLTGSMIQLGQALMGDAFKNTGVAKALGLTQIAIDEGKAIAAALFNSQANPANAATGGLAGIATFATVAASITSAAVRARAILKGGSSGGGGASLSTGPAAFTGQSQFSAGKTADAMNSMNEPYRYVLVTDHYEKVARRARRNEAIGASE